MSFCPKLPPTTPAITILANIEVCPNSELLAILGRQWQRLPRHLRAEEVRHWAGLVAPKSLSLRWLRLTRIHCMQPVVSIPRCKGKKPIRFISFLFDEIMFFLKSFI